MPLTWARALAWRLEQQLLAPVGDLPVEGVVARLGALPARSSEAAELAVRLRRVSSAPGEVTDALNDGRLLKTYAFRGATHLMTPEDAGTYLALRAASRMWELPSWQECYGLAPSDWPDLCAVVREALADGPLTRRELADAVAAVPRFQQLRTPVVEGNDTLLKPLAWQGVMSFGPTRQGRSTFARLEDNPRWAGIPDVDDAGPRAVRAYLHAYGPASVDRLGYWLADGLGAGRRRVRSWVAALGDELTEVDVDGEDVFVLSQDLDALRATEANAVARLLPGHDQWVLGPGTADPHVVPPARRALVTGGANLVVVGGVVSGTWRLIGDDITLSWFGEAGPVPWGALEEDVVRLGAVLGRRLRPGVVEQ